VCALTSWFARCKCTGGYNLLDSSCTRGKYWQQVLPWQKWRHREYLASDSFASKIPLIAPLIGHRSATQAMFFQALNLWDYYGSDDIQPFLISYEYNTRKSISFQYNSNVKLFITALSMKPMQFGNGIINAIL